MFKLTESFVKEVYGEVQRVYFEGEVVGWVRVKKEKMEEWKERMKKPCKVSIYKP